MTTKEMNDKSKTIRTILEALIYPIVGPKCEAKDTDEFEFNEGDNRCLTCQMYEQVDLALSDISKIIDEAKPDKIVYFADIKPPFDGQTDLSYLKGRAVGHNLAIDQYQSNLKERLK